MKPTELSRQLVSPDTAHVSLWLPPELFWFQGHFSEQPILPGLAQIDWVLRYGYELFAMEEKFKGIDSVKFQSPIRPSETLLLKLHWQADRARLDFTYEVEHGTQLQLVSNGRISLGA